MAKKYAVLGVDCAHCASLIEKALDQRPDLSEVTFNFAAATIALEPHNVESARQLLREIEPGAEIVPEEEARQDQTTGKLPVILRVIIFGAAGILFAIGIAFNSSLQETKGMWAEYAVFLAAYGLVGWRVILAAIRSFTKGKFFDENFLMCIATAGAIALHELPEAVGVMLFYYVGEFFQDLAVNRSRGSIKSLVNLKPETANLIDGDDTISVAPDELEVGDTILIRPGERVPVDGSVVEGASDVDTSALTGESAPRSIVTGDPVFAGTVNGGGMLKVSVTRLYAESSAARILDLVENAAARKSPTEKIITRFSRVYTPLIVLGSLGLAFIPPLLIPGALLSDWVYRALVLLVISCPCALVISIPLGYFGGIGAASKKGILLKGANFLEGLSHVETVVFDKTGTLTEGYFRVTSVMPENGLSEAELLDLCAHAESGSNHPIAKSIVRALGNEIKSDRIGSYEEVPGYGVKTVVDGRDVMAGNDRYLHLLDIPHENCITENTAVNVVVDGVLSGVIIVADAPKDDAKEAVTRLKSAGVQTIAMLTGDSETVAAGVAKNIGVDQYFAGLLPEEKVERVEALIAAKRNPKSTLLFVGDGINDAPVIARADIGVAMGGLGSDAAVEAADVVLMDDKPAKLAAAISIANRTRRIVAQNIVFALAVKLFFVTLGIAGSATMWQAVIADVGVALLAVLNATRILSTKSS